MVGGGVRVAYCEGLRWVGFYRYLLIIHNYGSLFRIHICKRFFRLFFTS